ncbi:hypothetical protein A9Q84_08320 [Halobacteriovorax marinus]|uniref:Metallo-beta-lactamase domain-containing protein n=1 Tax=Halobacteriovorax marinus TaxID=97084 RepID=A0A1Y5F9J6_9BACT|nr:hypothetical protein A9Q84_08320 [Halobacteriovorax marinus]
MHTYPTGQLGTNSTFLFNTETKDLIIFDGGHQKELSFQIIEDNNLKLEKIVHTHTHFDHCLATKDLSDKYGADIWMHKEEDFLYSILPQQALYFGMQAPAPNKVDHYFVHGENISFKNVEGFSLKAICTPGHTPGGTCFYTEDLGVTPILIAGDTLFLGSVGRTDLPGGNQQQLLDSIKNELLSLPEETIVICGHGPTTTIGAEKRNNPFLQ